MSWSKIKITPDYAGCLMKILIVKHQ